MIIISIPYFPHILPTFYDTKNGKGKRTVDWKVNRAVFFSRIERKTWHSYAGDERNNRIVLVYNLMTKFLLLNLWDDYKQFS